MMNESPPVLVGERVFWLGSGSGLPKRGTVKWLGRLAEMGPGWAVGVELEEELPVGGIDGGWGGRKLFSCRPKHGLIVPAQSLLGQRRTVTEGSQTAGRERQKERRLQAQSRRSENENTSAVAPGKNNVLSNAQRSTDRRTGRTLALPGDHLTRTRGEDVYSWMVDRQRQHERVFLQRMDARRRELNRSLDEGLAFDSPRNSYHSSRSAGSKRSSGIFNLFRWFKKERNEDSDFEVPSVPGSPVLQRGASGSVDTLFSTATANSFAYVHPLQYRPFGLADQPEIRIQVGPETSTYRNRIRNRDRLRALEQNISLREKYRLYASGTLPRSVDHIHELTEDLNEFKKALDAHKEKCSTLGRKKRRAPEPPTPQSSIDEDSENKQPESSLKQHRRTVSEPVKFHVKGKRKAPPPPGTSIDSDVISISTSNSNSSRRSRKKRRAPSPPVQNKENCNGIVNIIREAANGILNEEIVASGNESLKEETASNASTLDISLADVVCTDTLKLERGILKPNMDRPYTEPKICPSSPVSPRPWYKRAANRDIGSMKDKDKKKERDRRKVEDWMIESGIPRRSLINYDNKYNIFSRHDKTEDKRKSQISILTNISELDREAAEIIRRGKEREKNLIESHNAMYYSDNVVIADNNNESKPKNGENLSNNSSSDLFSLFNAITKVTASSSVTPPTSSTVLPVENNMKIPKQKYEKNFKNADNKYPIEIESFDEVIHRRLPQKPEIVIVEEDKPGTSSSSSVNSNGKIARVTIEELDDFDAERNSKSQLLFEANKQNRNLSPPIPTITEVSEGSAKSSPSSTIAEKPEPNAPAASSEVQLIQVKQMNVWICPRCTLENLRWRITCETCDMWRPNPFELREKTNIVPVNNGSKSEPTNKNSKIYNKENKSLYPNLSPIKTESESDKASKTKTADVIIDKDKSIVKENIAQVEKRDSDILASSSGLNVESKKMYQNGKNVEKEAKVTNALDNKIMYDKEPIAVIVTNNTPILSESTKKHTEAINKNQTALADVRKENKKKEENISDKISNIAIKTDLLKEEPKDQKLLSTEADEVRKARLAFFNKSVVDKNKEENNTTVEVDVKKVSNLKLDEGNKAVISEKVNDNKTSLPKVVNHYSEKDDKPIINKVVNNDIKSSQPHSSKVEISTTIEIQKQPNINLNDDIEKKKLKEMLIEMKHSLPKRPKPVKKLEHQNAIDGKSKESKSDIVISVPSTSNKEPILNENVIKPTTSSTIEPKPSTSESNDYAEAYLIESETLVEEIKIKKPSGKVSSSVQTSGLVTQISPKVKPSSGKELVIPIKIEEHTIKDGVLYTSVSSGVKKIGTGTFQLLRPRDFANIKEIKTEAKTGAPLPVYANIADDDSNASVKSEEAGVNTSDYIDRLSRQLVKPQGVANFKARLDVKNDKNMNTLAVNRLLKRLEGAIAGGQHELAAALARELAQMKVSCSVIRQKQPLPTKEILLELYVEDKTSHQGPFHLKVRPTITVLELKELVEREYEIPLQVQRWILANQLASDETRTLESMGVNTDGFPVFLYLVAPDPNIIKVEEVIEIEVKPATSAALVQEDTENVVPEMTPAVQAPPEEPKPGPSGVQLKKEPIAEVQINPVGTLALGWKCERCTLLNSPTRPGCAACGTGRPQEYVVPEEYKPNEAEARRIENETKNDQASAKNVEEEKAQNYQKLVDLEKDDLIIYPEEFECPVCLVEYPKMEGIVLRECLHVFCRTCLENTIHFSEEAEVKCPFRDNNYTCDSTLLEREIKALVTPKAFEEHLAKSIALAETKIGNAFHCKTPDCVGWCIYEDNVNVFKCPVCTHTNCLTCQAVHEGLDCKQYQEQLNSNSDMNIEVKRTKEMLQEMVDRGEAMNCPTCQVVLMKKWGCDWLRCSMCKTEICWITRGPRWGPNGKGDTSGGCQCGVNGIKCHPKCTYCH